MKYTDIEVRFGIKLEGFAPAKLQEMIALEIANAYFDYYQEYAKRYGIAYGANPIFQDGVSPPNLIIELDEVGDHLMGKMFTSTYARTPDEEMIKYMNEFDTKMKELSNKK